MTESLCLLSPARGGGRARPVSFDTLEDVDLIFPGSPHPIRSLVEAEAARRGMKLRVTLEIDAVGVIVRLVAEGHGHAVVPYNVVRAGVSRVAVRPITRPTLGSMVALVLPARRPATLLVEGVTGILRAVMAQRLKPRPAARKRSDPD